MSMQEVKFAVNESGIPQYMRESARFCFWRLITRDNGDATKKPFNPNAPKLGAQTNHPETFGTLEQSMEACRKYGGSGIGVNLQDGLWAIDIDHCVDENGHMSEMAIDIIRTMNSPVEYSPRGGGLHIYFRADHAAFLPENYYFNNRKIGLEVYPSGLTNRFMTVTGKHLPDTPEDIEGDRSTEVITVLERYMKREHPKGSSGEGGGISFLTDEEVLRHPGTIIELIDMQDEWTNLQPGDIGTVQYVDDAGQIQMRWRRGSRLALIPGVDNFKIIGHEEHI